MQKKDKTIRLELTEEHQEIIDLVDKICLEHIVPNRAEWDANETFPHIVLDKFKEAGVQSLLFESTYGGMYETADQLLVSALLEKISQYCLGVATSVGAIKLGALPIEVGGTAEQKKKYLPSLADGSKISAFALSEPSAGSDVPNMSTIAVKKGDKYILNGTKQWISNAGEAHTYTIFAITDKNKGPRGISCFIVEKGTKGLSFGNLENKLGIRCSHTRQVILEDCEIPEENLIGLKPNMGFVHALKTLNLSRPFIASCSVGLTQGAYNEAVKYAFQREQFGKKIINFQALNHLLADMLVKLETARLLSYRAAAYAQLGHPNLPKYSAMAKYYASEVAVQVANDALQVHGGYGFTKDYPIEKMYRDAKILTIYEGTSQIQKNEIGVFCIKDGKRLQ